MRLYVVRSMLGDDRGGRRLVPPQSISGHAIRDRLHLVRSEALELRTPSSSRTPMAPTVRQKRARNAVYQARWRAKRDALARANSEVIERLLMQEAERCGQLRGADCFSGQVSGRGDAPSVACDRVCAGGEKGANGRALRRLAAVSADRGALAEKLRRCAL